MNPEEDICDKHQKTDCMECFYTTRAESPQSELPQEWEKEFEKKFSYSSFTWNGDNNTGVKFAKQTKTKIKSFIKSTIAQVLAEKIKLIDELHPPTLNGQELPELTFKAEVLSILKGK